MPSFVLTAATFAVTLTLGCGGGNGGGGTSLGTGGTSSGTGGKSGSPGTGGSGGGGAASGGSSGQGGSGQGGTSGDGTGGAAPSGTGGSSPSGTGGGTPAGTGGSSGDAGSTDTGSAGDAASRPARALLFTRHMTQTHEPAINAAMATLTNLFKTISVELDITDSVAMITPTNLQRYGAIILVNNGGTFFGTPGTTEIAAVTAFVRAGGGLAAFHAAGNTEYGAGSPYPALLGGSFRSQGGGFRNANCTPEGGHPTVTSLPSTYRVMNEEFYLFDMFSPMNKVVLTCDPAPGMGADKIPISWVREEGAGRVFYSALGHYPAMWANDGPFLQNHGWPAILWVMGRTP
jgi:type 1 glutamine amidotransferase